jgi:hypothetical protein
LTDGWDDGGIEGRGVNLGFNIRSKNRVLMAIEGARRVQ